MFTHASSWRRPGPIATGVVVTPSWGIHPSSTIDSGGNGSRVKPGTTVVLFFRFNCQTAQGMFTHASSWRRPGPIATGVRGYAELGHPPFFNNRRRWKWVPGQARDDSGFVFPFQLSNSGEDTRPHCRGAMRPSFWLRFTLLSAEGAGKAGCALHPRSRADASQLFEVATLCWKQRKFDLLPDLPFEGVFIFLPS